MHLYILPEYALHRMTGMHASVTLDKIAAQAVTFGKCKLTKFELHTIHCASKRPAAVPYKRLLITSRGCANYSTPK
jgi:hypothetical protein